MDEIFYGSVARIVEGVLGPGVLRWSDVFKIDWPRPGERDSQQAETSGGGRQALHEGVGLKYKYAFKRHITSGQTATSEDWSYFYVAPNFVNCGTVFRIRSDPLLSSVPDADPLKFVTVWVLLWILSILQHYKAIKLMLRGLFFLAPGSPTGFIRLTGNFLLVN
jgi:hypothetical protein